MLHSKRFRLWAGRSLSPGSVAVGGTRPQAIANTWRSRGRRAPSEQAWVRVRAWPAVCTQSGPWRSSPRGLVRGSPVPLPWPLWLGSRATVTMATASCLRSALLGVGVFTPETLAKVLGWVGRAQLTAWRAEPTLGPGCGAVRRHLPPGPPCVPALAPVHTSRLEGPGIRGRVSSESLPHLLPCGLSRPNVSEPQSPRHTWMSSPVAGNDPGGRRGSVSLPAPCGGAHQPGQLTWGSGLAGSRGRGHLPPMLALVEADLPQGLAHPAPPTQNEGEFWGLTDAKPWGSRGAEVLRAGKQSPR